VSLLGTKSFFSGIRDCESNALRSKRVESLYTQRKKLVVLFALILQMKMFAAVLVRVERKVFTNDRSGHSQATYDL